MEFDLTTMMANTLLFSFKALSNYYLKIVITGVFWTASASCEVAGGVSNSYGAKPLCSWINSNTILINQFDAIDVNTNLGGRYRLKIHFPISSYSVNGYYTVSASLYLYANF